MCLYLSQISHKNGTKYLVLQCNTVSLHFIITFKYMKKSPPKRKDNNPATTVRLPPGLKENAAKKAKEENRSLSNLIVTAIKKYIE